MIVSATKLLRQAYGKYIIGAYSVCNLEQIMGLFLGNLGKVRNNQEPSEPDRAAPFIVQITPSSCRYTDRLFLETLIRTAENVFPEAIFSVHFDGGTEQQCYEYIDSGLYSSVMVGASHEPLENNIAITKRVVDHARPRGIAVEAEMASFGAIEESFADSDSHLSDALQLVEFVQRTGCDALVVTPATSHGRYKFSREHLKLDGWLPEISKELPPNFPLVIRRSVGVPQNLLDRINAAGGKVEPAQGDVSDEDYALLSQAGVCKAELKDIRYVWCANVRENFRDKPADVDLRTSGARFMRNFAEHVAQTNQILGSAGQLETVRQALSTASNC